MTKKNLFFKITVLFAVIFSFGTQSCTKLGNNLHFTLKLQPPALSITIPPIPVVDSTNAIRGSTPYYFNVDSFIKAGTGNLLSINNITNVKITACNFNFTNATTPNNWANFQNVNIAFHSDANTSDFLINSGTIPDIFQSTLALPVDTTADLSSYFKGNNFNYSIGGKMRRITTDTLKCNIQLSFSVTVNG